MRTAVITIVSGRHGHLLRQLAHLRRAVPGADQHVVVAMGRGEDKRCRLLCRGASEVVGIGAGAHGLPLARARNVGAEHALRSGARLLVFLDVDCLPGPSLVRRYQEAAHVTGPALLCGPVAYLPPSPSGGYADTNLRAIGVPHPGRPVPAEGALRFGGDHALFWTLSFAVTDDSWREVGGFCEDYVGYGAEDTDYGQLARRAGVSLCWVGGAWAYHQYHAIATPPVQHLDQILRNAGTFHERWGWWPMGDWLESFAEQGLARHDLATDRWVRGCDTNWP